jgi:hypothetical protein
MIRLLAGARDSSRLHSTQTSWGQTTLFIQLVLTAFSSGVRWPGVQADNFLLSVEFKNQLIYMAASVCLLGMHRQNYAVIILSKTSVIDFVSFYLFHMP